MTTQHPHEFQDRPLPIRPLNDDEKSFEGVHHKLDIVVLQVRTLGGRIVGLDRVIRSDVTPRLDSLDRGMFEVLNLLKAIGGEVRHAVSDAAEANRVALAVRESQARAPMPSWTDEVVQKMVTKQVDAQAEETDLEIRARNDKEVSRAKMRANLVRLCYILGTVLLAALARYLR